MAVPRGLRDLRQSERLSAPRHLDRQKEFKNDALRGLLSAG
jgi:hypothetical protein